MAMDVIDYRIFGDDIQFVEIELDPGEAAIGEAGAMMMMEDGIQMDTVFGDGSSQSAQGGLLGKLMGAGKRLLTGESLFTTIFHNEGVGKRRVSFAAPYPGQIVPVSLRELGGSLICQKDSFLCAARGVSLGIVGNYVHCKGYHLGRDRIYGAWWPSVVDSDAKAAVARSAERYIAAISEE